MRAFLRTCPHTFYCFFLPCTEKILKELVLDKGKVQSSLYKKIPVRLIVNCFQDKFLRMSIRYIEENMDVVCKEPKEDRVVSLRELKKPQKKEERTSSQTKQLLDSPVVSHICSKKAKWLFLIFEKLTYELLEAQLHLFARLCRVSKTTE